MPFELHNGDSRDVLDLIPTNSIDSCVTDPPYALVSVVQRFGNSPRSERTENMETPYGRTGRGFMGQKWDTGEVAHDVGFWREVLRVLKPGAHLVAFGGTRTYHRLAVAIEDAGFEIRDQIGWAYGSGFPKSHNQGGGWGTALKPAWEPIVLARKPLVGTVAGNRLVYGTGAINIDDCRTIEGRWPANIIHDGSDEVQAAFPQAPGQLAKAAEGGDRRKDQNVYGAMTRGSNGAEPRSDSGSAARFFYCAKASKTDREEGNVHPTVKPTALMRYLCRLVTPPGGTVLDPFAGSGSTGKAAVLGGFNFIGIEREVEYAAIAKARIGAAEQCDPFQ